MGNLDLYNKLRSVPAEAQKSFNNGRFSGTDINPMWRIKMLTETFGPAGEGWWVENVRFWSEPCEDGNVLAFCSLELVIRDKHHLFGVGGSKLVTVEKRGPYADDEGYKKAYTDALSVACKSLGMGADVYWDKDTTKYTSPRNNAPAAFDEVTEDDLPFKSKSNYEIVKELIAGKNVDVAGTVTRLFGAPIKVNDLNDLQFKKLCEELKR